MLESLRNPLFRALVAALAVLALLGTAACGGGEEEAQQPEEPAPAQPAPEETAAGGAMKEEYATGYEYQYGEYGPGGVGCELTKATADMTPEEARAYADEVFEESVDTGDKPRQILNDRGFTCEEGGQ